MAQKTNSATVCKVSLLDAEYRRFFKVCDQDGFAFNQMRTTAKKDKNWHAFYFQTNIQQALGYASDKTNPSGYCTLVCFDWLPSAAALLAYKISDKAFGDLTIDGATKAKLAKSLLGLAPNCDLMPSLGGVLHMLETDNDIEVVISQQCFTPEYVRPRVLAQLKFVMGLPFISHWRIIKQNSETEWGEWHRCAQWESDDPTKLVTLAEWNALAQLPVVAEPY